MPSSKPAGESQAEAPERFARIANYYSDLIQRYGHDPRACDYGRAESQQAKFRVLSECADLRGRSVLDVGCGFADFSDYLAQRFEGVAYSGIDLTPDMIAHARQRHPGLSLEVRNLLEMDASQQYDVVMANGIFYLLGDRAAELMRSFVARMWQMAKVAVAFNTLSSWAPDQEAGEFYADPVETLAFCRTLTPRLTLRHDYHRRDFTVYMYRDPA
jgi:cyclopropane fatty-acyl-phospholipid synthase-like methyltransferase